MDGLCEISKYSIHANKIIFITTQFSEMENKHVFAVFDEIIKIWLKLLMYYVRAFEIVYPFKYVNVFHLSISIVIFKSTKADLSLSGDTFGLFYKVEMKALS